MKTVVVISGGMDSTTLAYRSHHRGDEAFLLSVDYGQRHRKELEYAKLTATRLGVSHEIVDLSSLRGILAGSSLTSEVDVPDGHYAEETMKATVVPNRNSIMINVAIGYAVSIKADSVSIGVHAGDHFVYPDCRPEFVLALAEVAKLGNEGFISSDFFIDAPYVNIGKHDIALEGESLGVNWNETWSCYKGKKIHCGSCGTCFERREAFWLAGVKDPTEYEATPEYQAPPDNA